MPPCTELHIPYKKWAQGVGLPAAHQDENNWLAVERWARDQSCGGGGGALPKMWCATGFDTLSQFGNLLVTTSPVTTEDLLFVTATADIQNMSGGALDVSVFGYFYSDLDLNNNQTMLDQGFSWPSGARRTLSASCLVQTGSDVGFDFFNFSAGDVFVNLSVQVLEVDGQTSACCTGGA